MISRLAPFTPGHPTYLARTGELTGLSVRPALGPPPPFLCLCRHAGPCGAACVFYLLTPSLAAYFLSRVWDSKVTGPSVPADIVSTLRRAADLISDNIPPADLAAAAPWRYPDTSDLLAIPQADWSGALPDSLYLSAERRAGYAALQALPVLRPGELDSITAALAARRRVPRVSRKKALK